MARPGPLGSLGIPRAQALAWIAGALLLTAFFVARGLPYERLAALLSAAVARSSPLALQIGQLGPHLSPLGPGVRATGVRIVAPGGAALRVETLTLRPAWSLRWLRLRPTFRVAARLAGGSLDGTLGDEPSFAGELAAIDLAQVPVAALWHGGALSGTLDAKLDLRAAEAGPEGSIALEGRDGSVVLPGVPLPLAFATLGARLALGGGAMLRVEALDLSGPGLGLRVTGQLGHAPSFAQAPCNLEVAIEADAGLATGLRSLGVRLGRDGRGTLRITGTPERPVVQ